MSLPDIEIPWSLLSQGSAWSLVTFGVVLFFRGLLIPRSLVDLWLDVKDKSATEWHAAYLASEETAKVQAKQIDELLEIARRDAHLLELIESHIRGIADVDS